MASLLKQRKKRTYSASPNYPLSPTADSGQIKIGQYILGETLGSGTFGKVKKATHSVTEHTVAIKILNRNKLKNLDVVGKIRREIQNLRLFRHPHIIKLYQVITTPSDIFMVMEFVAGGELFDYIVKKGKLNEREARRFFHQIISGVDYCHRHLIVHRDLKPENLLLDDNMNVKIADFGLSNMIKDGEFLQTSCGSPNYAAPEVVSGEWYAGPEVDIWSCGVILYAFLTGSLPFDDDNVQQLFKKIKSGIFMVPAYLSDGVVDLLKIMLMVDPIKRATIADIRDHAWFKVDLLSYLFPSPNAVDSNIVDADTVREISEKFCISETDVHKALLLQDNHDQIVIAYNLITDNKRILCEAQKIEVSEFYLASSPPRISFLSFMQLNQHRTHPETMPPLTGFSPALNPLHYAPNDEAIHSRRLRTMSGGSAGLYANQAENQRRQRGYAGLSISPLLDKHQVISRVRESWESRYYCSKVFMKHSNAFEDYMPESPTADPLPIRRRGKWHLGIRSQSQPQDIMHEVFKALKKLDMKWKYINNSIYNVMACHSNSTKPFSLVGLQLYQVDPKSFLLDFRYICRPKPKAQDSHTQTVTRKDTDCTTPQLASQIANNHTEIARELSENGSKSCCTESSIPADVLNMEHTVSSETMKFFEQCALLVSVLSK